MQSRLQLVGRRVRREKFHWFSQNDLFLQGSGRKQIQTNKQDTEEFRFSCCVDDTKNGPTELSGIIFLWLYTLFLLKLNWWLSVFHSSVISPVLVPTSIFLFGVKTQHVHKMFVDSSYHLSVVDEDVVSQGENTHTFAYGTHTLHSEHV